MRVLLWHGKYQNAEIPTGKRNHGLGFSAEGIAMELDVPEAMAGRGHQALASLEEEYY